MKTVYSLTASDEPLQVRYVGATVYGLDRRLRGHTTHHCNARKRAWMREVKARGARVVIQPLSTHDTIQELLVAERRWMAFWGQYCDLTNERAATRSNARPNTVHKLPRPPMSFKEIFDAVGHDLILRVVEAELEYQGRAKISSVLVA